jgi:hypothetical protein
MRLGLQVGTESERGISAVMESNALLGQVTFELLQGPKARDQAIRFLQEAHTALRAGSARFQAAQNYLLELAHYIEKNASPAYERHLQNCGFRGAHFILVEYKHHLERVEQGITGAEPRWTIAEEAVRAGEIDNFEKDFYPGVNRAMRFIFRAVIDLMIFQHQAAETRYALLGYPDRPRFDEAVG